jgi:hypothetical protein
MEFPTLAWDAKRYSKGQYKEWPPSETKLGAEKRHCGSVIALVERVLKIRVKCTSLALKRHTDPKYKVDST